MTLSQSMQSIKKWYCLRNPSDNFLQRTL